MTSRSMILTLTMGLGGDGSQDAGEENGARDKERGGLSGVGHAHRLRICKDYVRYREGFLFSTYKAYTSIYIPSHLPT